MKTIGLILIYLLLSIPGNAQQILWELTNFPPFFGRITSFGSMGDTLLVTANGLFNGGVLFSRDFGLNWVSIDTGLSDKHINGVAICGSRLYAGSDRAGMFFSTNFGRAWHLINDGLTNLGITGIAVIDTFVFAATGGGGVFRQTASSISWEPASSGLTNLSIAMLEAVGTDIFTGAYYHFYRSTDLGISWVAVDSTLPDRDVIACTRHGGGLFVGTYSSGVYVSYDNCQTWVPRDSGLGTGFIGIHDFADSGNRLFCANAPNRGVYSSTNGGIFWEAYNNSLSDLQVSRLAVFQGHLFAGTFGGAVWRRQWIVDGARGPDEVVSRTFDLGQNYPNPFNPTTTIRFDIPQQSDVGVSIHNSLGQLVRILINGQLDAGTHSVVWDGRDNAGVRVSSGVYYYRVQIGEHTQVRKMVMIK